MGLLQLFKHFGSASGFGIIRLTRHWCLRNIYWHSNLIHNRQQLLPMSGSNFIIILWANACEDRNGVCICLEGESEMRANKEEQVVNAERLDEKVTLMKTINRQLGELYRNTFDGTGTISAPFGEEGLSLPINLLDIQMLCG